MPQAPTVPQVVQLQRNWGGCVCGGVWGVRGGCRKRQCCLICCLACPFLTALLPAPWERGALLRLAQAAGSGPPRAGSAAAEGSSRQLPPPRQPCHGAEMGPAPASALRSPAAGADAGRCSSRCASSPHNSKLTEELSSPPRAGRAAQPLGDVPVAGALFAAVNAAAGCQTPRVPPNPPV